MMTKPFNATVVQLTANDIQEIHDHTQASGTEVVNILIFKDKYIGIDTETRLRLPAPVAVSRPTVNKVGKPAIKVVSKKAGNYASKYDAKISREVVMKALEGSKQLTTMEIGDRLRIPRPDTNLRSRLAVILRAMAADNTLVQVERRKHSGGSIYKLP